MASFKVEGITEFELDLKKIAELPDSVLMNMANKGAAVIVRKIKAKGEAMGVHRTGVTLSSIKATKAKRTRDGITVTVTPTGNNKDGNRNAEVAFINNYGRPKSKEVQPARPFFTDGVAESENEACEAAEKEYDNYLKSNNL